MRSLVVATIAVLALLPASALAVETEGTGENVRHVKSVPHTEKWNKDKQQGTDFELATITTVPAATLAPATPAAPARPKAKKRKKAKRYRYVRKCRTVKRGGKRVRRCKRVRVPVRSRARKSDADPATPGIQRTFAFAGSYYDGIDIIDVTDPEKAEKVAWYDCGIGQGDVQILRRDGRVYVVYAQDDGYAQYSESRCVVEAEKAGFKPSKATGGSYIVDVTNPYKPEFVSYFAAAQGEQGAGSHNVTVHPSGRYLYNSNADLVVNTAPAIEIVDLTDLRKPRIAGEFALQYLPLSLGSESHDIAFNAAGDRAYVAALSHAEILDTTNPLEPKLISTIEDPSLNVWHQAEQMTVGGKSYLIAEDEFAGAQGTGMCPSGGLHVYDISDETAPVKVGSFNLDEAGVATGNDVADEYAARCTSHVFSIDRDAQLMTLGWYNLGVRVLDLSELEGHSIGSDLSTGGIKQLGYFKFPSTDVWAAKATRMDRNGFFFFGNDKRRGFDVYRYTPGATASVPQGEWLDPAETLARTRRLQAGGTKANLFGACMLANR